MDPNLLAIFLGLITNGITSLLAMSGKKAGELLIGKDFLEKWEIEKTALDPILRTAINDVAETITWNGPIREEVISLFLRSSEVEEIVRQIYSTILIDDNKRTNLESIHDTFLALFSQFVNFYPDGSQVGRSQLTRSADVLFDNLIKGCNIVLQSTTDKGILAAHEAKSSLRYHIIMSEVDSIQKKLDFLLAQEKLDLNKIFDFERKYRSQVGSSHGYITPPNFDLARKFPIDKLFVSPRLSTTSSGGVSPKLLTMDEFMSSIHRAVVLGNPGGGKSTLSLKLIHDTAIGYPNLEFAGRKQVTPILVVLREYGADKKDRNCSILEFIETEVKATYQLTPPPPSAFEYLLLNGKAIVIFDGLDELLDTSYRQEIRNDVEAFCRLYPSIPVVVTSRVVGYEQAPLDEDLFETFALDEFDDPQVSEYVTKWFGIADKEAAPNQRQKKISAFLEESKVVPDLRSNPLMLALLCNIYHGENYIPRNRPEVYDKCSLMLFERWDRGRNLYAPPLLEEQK